MDQKKEDVGMIAAVLDMRIFLDIEMGVLQVSVHGLRALWRFSTGCSAVRQSAYWPIRGSTLSIVTSW